jgi:uncharacterized membrane protein
MPQTHIQDHVDLIAKHEQEFLARRTPWERVSDSIAGWIGSAWFIAVHVMVYATWITFNTLHGTDHFDPRPFGLLQALSSIEAILIASLILMRQTRLGRRSDERDHLMLQILLLTEKEITAVLGINREIATEVGLEEAANAENVRELSQDTQIEEVAQSIQENLPGQ